jgi:methylthioribose-1-phosphate isomerase
MHTCIPSPIAWSPDGLRVLDQTLLPSEEAYRELRTIQDVAEAIRTLQVRGAPLIGIAAAMGLAMEAGKWGSREAGKHPTVKTRTSDIERPIDGIEQAAEVLGSTRPTAVNLRWAIERMLRRAREAGNTGDDLGEALLAEANAIWEEDRAMCRRIGELGAALIPPGATVCTVCNAGALATGGIGTALAPVYVLHEAGRAPHVLVPETRPLLQGSRLTAWELHHAGVGCTVIADGMVASRLRRGDVACVLVGADRIAANGDVANKIGTYALALAARAHGVPFYVAAPSSTVDLDTPDGTRIPIEEREPEEVTSWRGVPAAPKGVGVWNPAFDVTPASLVTGIITDRGIVAPGELSGSPSTAHR